MKALMSVLYEGNKVTITYEEDSVQFEYVMYKDNGKWSGDNPVLDRFFTPLLKKGEE